MSASTVSLAARSARACDLVRSSMRDAFGGFAP
jgi:hypothetical protein